MKISRLVLVIVSVALLSGLVGCSDEGVTPVVEERSGLTGTFYVDLTAQDYTGVWAFSPDHMFVIAEDNVVIEIKGDDRILLPLGREIDLKDIWASSPSDVIVAGAKPGETGGEILRYNGRSWRSMPHSLKGAVNSVFGSGRKDVYAVTSEGEIARYDGFVWYVVHTVDRPLTEGWAGGPDDVHVVGDDGLYVHFDGSSWESLISKDYPLIGVRGISESDAWLFSARMVWTVESMRIDGSPYSRFGSEFYAVASNNRDDLYIVGDNGRIVQYDGEYWNNIEVRDPEGSHVDLVDVSMTGPLRAVAVGRLSTVVDIDGYTTSLTRSDRRGARILAGAGDMVLGAAHSMYLASHDGSQWADFDPPIPQDLSGEVACMWAASPDIIWVVTGGWPLQVLHFDGTAWNQQMHVDDITQSMWGTAADDIFLVGWEGNIWHYDGSAWALMADTGYERVLQDTWGAAGDDVYVVGAYTTTGLGGAVLHYDGASWSVDPTFFEHDLYAVDGTSPSDIVAVGREGAIYRFDGTAWHLEPSGTTSWLTDVWAGAPDDYWAVGFDGSLLHYNGDSWQDAGLGLESILWSVWGTDTGDVFITGDGILLRYTSAR
jgi:hypothetical protein